MIVCASQIDLGQLDQDGVVADRRRHERGFGTCCRRQITAVSASAQAREPDCAPIYKRPRTEGAFVLQVRLRTDDPAVVVVSVLTGSVLRYAIHGRSSAKTTSIPSWIRRSAIAAVVAANADMTGESARTSAASRAPSPPGRTKAKTEARNPIDIAPTTVGAPCQVRGCTISTTAISPSPASAKLAT
jgi:hypothetical protein